MAKGTKNTEEKEEKDAFQKVLDSLEKKYGTGVIMSGSDEKQQHDVISTGSLLLDQALGTGGYVEGKLIELTGPFSSGKSTLTLHAIANCQKKYPDREVLLMDGEAAIDVKYARKLGVNVNKLRIGQPGCAEDMYNQLMELIPTGKLAMVIIDSHTAIQPKIIVENEVGHTTIAPFGRTSSVALGKIKRLLKTHNTTIIAIAQMRTNVGGYGASDKPTGGKAWEFYPDIKISLQKEVDKEKEGNRTTATVTKNKCSPPFGKATFYIQWGTGIDRLQEIIDAAIEFKLIEKGGAWFTISEGVKLQGNTAVRQFMMDNSEYAENIEARVIGLLKENQE
jgi:recombination protein RecA